MPPKRLSILGVGLLGGSLGLAAKSRATDCIVAGYAHRVETLRAALQRGAIDEGYDTPAAAVRGADLVIVCTPVGLLGEMLDAIAPSLSSETVVTDVGSTKASIVRLADERHADMRFVGSHPMAGSEKRGVQFASADLFQSAVCIITPSEQTERGALSKVEDFWRLLGMRLTHLSPQEHDRLVGDASHLPHAVAAALVNVQPEAAFDLIGKGFLDATRIAAGDGGLWRDILLDNRHNIVGSIQRLKSQLDELVSLLEPEKSEQLREWLDLAAQRRNQAAHLRSRGQEQ